MWNKYKEIISIILILILAAVLRMYMLGSIPSSPDWDEASMGYNAFSILSTGRDEYGKVLPVVLESFADFKPAMYVYLTIPSVFIFGLSTFAVRLPAAILGVLAVLATYILVKELFNRRLIAMLAAFFVSISPLAVQFSRVGFEAGVGAAFNLFITLFFIKWVNTSRKLYLVAAVLFSALNLYVYQSEKVFTPLLVILLVIIYRAEIGRLSRKFILSLIVTGIVFSLPMIVFILSNHDALNRLASTSIFSAGANSKSTNWLLKNNPVDNLRDNMQYDYLGGIIDNRKIVLFEQILLNYSLHFDPNWLFIQGDDNGRHQSPQMGHLYLWDLPFFLIGIFALIYSKIPKRTRILILSWMLLVPIPAALTTDVPHAVRTLNFLPVLQIIIAIGCVNAFYWLRNRCSKVVFSGIVSIVTFCLIFNALFYLDSYFIQYNYYNSSDWQYGYQQAVSFAQQFGNNYKKIIVSSDSPLDQSYIFFLYYLKYPPYKYQAVSISQGSHYTRNHSFDKFEFRHIDMRELDQRSNSGNLYIIPSKDLKDNSRVLSTIYTLKGDPIISVVSGG